MEPTFTTGFLILIIISIIIIGIYMKIVGNIIEIIWSFFKKLRNKVKN